MIIPSLMVLAIWCAALLTMSGCAESNFGKTADGSAVKIYTLRNAAGMEARITNYGGIVVSLKTPDRNGKFDDVVLGFDSMEGYRTNPPYFGAIIGRYANRIAGGKFTLNGVKYQLPVNSGTNCLHGGIKGFDKVVWTPTLHKDDAALELTYVSRDGEEGFPGTLTAKVVYTLTDQNELKIDYTASTDKDTVVNLTNHCYFNLAGQGNGTVLNSEITINADAFTPVDQNLIPTGELQPVEGTPLDLRRPAQIGAQIDDPYPQMAWAGGYDHNWVLNKKPGELSFAARVSEPTTGRVLEVWTTQPGIQFYTANFLDGTLIGKGGNKYRRRGAFCLETQHYPDSPNQPNFPSVVLKPAQTYHETTIYRFSAK
jgi:aldose 1-epimerase